MKSSVAHRCFLSFVFQGDSSAEGGPTEGPPDRHTTAASGPSSSSSLCSLWSQRLKNLLFIHRQDPVPEETRVFGFLPSAILPSSFPNIHLPGHAKECWSLTHALVAEFSCDVKCQLVFVEFGSE
jgi:hypothetical protein